MERSGKMTKRLTKNLGVQKLNFPSVCNFVYLIGKNVPEVHVQTRLDVLKMTGKQPLMYHSMNVSNPYATLNIQIKPLMENTIVTESLFLMARYQKLPILSNCDFIHSVSTIINTDGNYKLISHFK